jgi:hypothetical protein
MDGDLPGQIVQRQPKTGDHSSSVRKHGQGGRDLFWAGTLRTTFHFNDPGTIGKPIGLPLARIVA